MSYIPCRYARQWPDVWASLPSDADRWALSNTLANGRLEGMEPSRELVEDMAASTRGELNFDAFKRRAVQRALRTDGARNAVN